MQRRGNGGRDVRFATDDDGDYEYQRTSFTYRPLSRLPTPPPTLSKPPCADQSLEDDDTLDPRHRGEFLAAHPARASVEVLGVAQTGIRIAECGIRSITAATLWGLPLPLWTWANHMADSFGLQVPPSIS